MIEQLIILDRKIVNVNSEIKHYEKHNKRFKLFFAKRKLKKLKKQYNNINEKINKSYFWKK